MDTTLLARSGLVPAQVGPDRRHRDVLAAAARAGQLVRVRRGWYVGARTWEAATASARAVWSAQAVCADLPGAVVSHTSAALVWRLPVLGGRDDRVEVLVPPAQSTRDAAGVRRRVVADVGDPVATHGLRLTRPGRTVVDLARTRGVENGTAAADEALRRGLTTTDELWSELERAGRGRGARAARQSVLWADAAAESVGESLSRVRILQAGLPAPVLQHEVRDPAGLVGRVDFWWPHLRLVGEFDGRTKYGADVADRRAPHDRLWHEKLREDRLRRLGLQVVRWTWDDAWDGARLVALLIGAGLARR
ncbi:hypothetical protein [Cellulomonas endophytica]|uniref:hypothetical protein n=1 Tax=Cellulomonas endophytica TaxID=2494735 RepID=UPI0010122231|nr:hypothetical protein [Cellulomonas endophytica]